jgi:hypothetical protein
MTPNETDPSLHPECPDPGVDRVYRYLMYGLSLPERTVRSTAAMVSGAVHESASLLVPQAFRDSKTYNTFVQQMLDVVSDDVGGVKKEVSAEAVAQVSGAKDPNGNEAPNPEVENYVARKTVSTFIDLAGMATLHVSPLTILAIVSDVAYGSQTYLIELSNELKREGIIAENSTIASTADLLEAIGSASAETADAFDTPPLSVDGLRETIQQTRDSVSRIDPKKLMPQSEIASMWTDMQAMAEKEDVSVFEISSAMTMYALERANTVTKGALTTIRVTGDLLDRHLFDHYWQGLQAIGEQGIYATVADSSRPYIEAVWFNFSSDRPTVTEDLVSGKMVGRVWSGLCDWMSSDKEEQE